MTAYQPGRQLHDAAANQRSGDLPFTISHYQRSRHHLQLYFAWHCGCEAPRANRAIGASIGDAAMRQQLVGWDMVDEDTKQAVPYSEDAREGLLQMSSAPYHVALAFFRASSGNKAKNS